MGAVWTRTKQAVKKELEGVHPASLKGRMLLYSFPFLCISGVIHDQAGVKWEAGE